MKRERNHTSSIDLSNLCDALAQVFIITASMPAGTILLFVLLPNLVFYAGGWAWEAGSIDPPSSRRKASSWIGGAAVRARQTTLRGGGDSREGSEDHSPDPNKEYDVLMRHFEAKVKELQGGVETQKVRRHQTSKLDSVCRATGDPFAAGAQGRLAAKGV